MILQAFFRTMSSDSDGVVFAIIGALVGVYLFYRGFRLLARRRLILNTPSSKVRSASIGLVEVSGLAVGPYTMTAPITGRPCYYYHTMAWQLKRSGKNDEWEKVADEGLYVPFYLDDNSGRVLVDPQGAEMAIHCDVDEQYGDSILSRSPEVTGNVAGFLARHGVSPDRRTKVKEYCIKPKNALFILGTLAENPGLKVTSDPQRTESTHAFTLGPKKSLDISFSSSISPIFSGPQTAARPSNLPRSSGAPPVSTEQQEKIAAAMVKAGITDPAAWAIAGVQYPGVTVHEKDGSIAATGTATVQEFDLAPKTVLMKGTHNPTFLISWRSQRDVAQSLGWKCTLMIWGGPALTLLCAYFLAAHLGWL